MLPYTLLLIVVLLTLLIIKVSNNSKLRFLPFLIMGLFSGLRYGVGVDTDNYVLTFNYILNEKTTHYDIEIGFELIVKIVHYMGGNPQIVFLLFALTTNYFIYKFIINNSINYYISTVLFLCIGPFYLSTMNGMRQALAVSVFAFCLKFIIDRKPIKYFGVLSFFSIFHYSLILMLPLYWLFKSKINYKVLLLSIPFVILIFRFGLVNNFIQLIGYGNLLDFDSNTLGASYMLFLGISIFIIFITEKIKRPLENEIINLNMIYLSIYIVVVGLFVDSSMSIIFTRFNSYFFISLIILVPFVISRFKERELLNVLVIFISILLYYNTLISARTMIPYQFNFDLFY